MRRSAFAGSVKGVVVQVMPTGVYLRVGYRQVVFVDYKDLDPVKTSKTLPGKRKPKKAAPTPKAPKVTTKKAAKPASAPRVKADMLVIVERKVSDFDRLREKGLLTSVDRTQYADK